MGKRDRKGKHAKRKGPGGPVRPISSAPSRRVSGGGGASLGAPPTGPLVDAILDGFEVDPSLEPIHRALHYELGAIHLFETFLAQSGPHLPSMLRSVASELGRRCTTDADRALAALARAAVGPAAPSEGARSFVRAWDRRRPGVDDPVALAIGEDVPVRAVEIGHVQGDGVNLALAIDNPLGRYTVAVYVDHNLGGIAKDLLIGPPIDDVEATFAPEQGFLRRDVPLAEAAWRFGEALDLTDHTLDAPISEDFEDLLPAVAVRFALVPPVEPVSMVDPDGNPIGYVEVSRAERLAHLGAFKASPEFARLPGDLAEDALGVVDLWIDHAVGYTVGKVRRVSPTLVELFCASWFPNKVMADEAMVAAGPVGIEAWLRFCARTTGLEDRWLDEALMALREFGPHLGRALDDPDAWSRGKGLLGGLLGDGADTTDIELTDILDEFADRESRSTSASWMLPHDITWQPLQQVDEGERVHIEADPSSVPPWQYVTTRIVASQASVQAASLLGPSFAQPAVDLAIAIGSAEPCLYDNTQIRSWPGTIVWLLADDSDGFSPRAVGRRRDDLAAALPMTRATYQNKVKRVREVLGVEKGAFRVDW